MKITIKETHIDIDQNTRKQVRGKMLKLGRWLRKLGTAVRLEIELERTTLHHRKGLIYRAEANLAVPKKLLRTEAFGEDILSAVEEMYKSLEREIEKYKMSKEEKNYRQARYEKRMSGMSSLAWRGRGREKEQVGETETEV